MNPKTIEIIGKSFAPLEAEECSANCAATGLPITRGIPKKKVLKTLNNIHTALQYPNGEYVSEPVARIFANDWNLSSKVFYDNGDMWSLLVSPESAADKGRWCWRDAVREMAFYEGEMVIIFFNGKNQKKIWPMAKPTRIGKQTVVTVCNPEVLVMRNLVIDWFKMLDIWQIVHSIRQAGFNSAKDRIAQDFDTSLLNNFKAVNKVGLAKAKEYDAMIASFRGSDELLFVQLIEGYKL